MFLSALVLINVVVTNRWGSGVPPHSRRDCPCTSDVVADAFGAGRSQNLGSSDYCHIFVW